MNNLQKFFLISIFAFFLITLVVVCKSSKKLQEVDNNKIKVVTSFYPLYFFASQIGGKYADVTNLTPIGAEPHDYEPTPLEIARIQTSNMLVINGAGLEVWGDKIIENLKNTQVRIVIVGNDIANQQVEKEGKKNQDPHVWLSPVLAKKIVNAILDGYLKIDKKNRNYYYANANKLLSELDNLDNDYKKGLANCLQNNIITSHAAFGYLATAYVLHQIPITGLSPDAEPSAKQLAEISRFAKKNNVKYIFFESLVSPKLAETIANEIGVNTLVLDPIEGISKDGEKQGENYFSIMKENLNNLKKALKCQ
jgi:zinc transport system substrate-binding protein